METSMQKSSMSFKGLEEEEENNFNKSFIFLQGIFIETSNI